MVTGFNRLVVQRNWRHPWLKWDQTLQWLGQVLTVCSLSTPHHLLVPVRVPCSTEHTVLAQKMKGSISSCACCQHNKKTFLWGHCERAVVARGHLCSLLRAVELIKPGEFPPFGSCRYFVCFLCCSFTLLGVFKQVGDFFFPPAAPLLPARGAKIMYSLLLSKKITEPADPNSSGTN